MSQTVDQRIVEMRFDNKQFEDGTKTTLSTLEKLKNALNFGEATDGFSDLSNAAKHCDVSHLGSAVDSIAERFSNMGIIGMRTLQNLADSAYNAGTKILKSLTLDPITQGYAKYEKKTAAVSTMLAQGFDQSEIDEELGKLQWFADETSYTFTDMVDSVSKFTASGQGLSDSVTALQGIALWASAAGQSAQTAGRAMYQLSQAMGSGQMRKEDWRSVQNANMDTKEFREMALQAGVRQGTVKRLDNGNWKSLMVKDGAEFSTSQFAEHLTEDAWFTREVMMDVYQSYASVTDKVKEFAETQDTTTREAIVQIKELKDLNLDNADAVQAFADKYDLLEEDVPKFKKMADACDEFGLKTFEAAQATKTFQELIDALQEAVASSWGTIFEYVVGNAEEAKELYSNLADGIWDYFNAVTDGLKEILGPWHDHMYGRQSILNGITYAFQNIIAVVDAVGEAFSEMFPPMKSWDLIAFSMKFEEFMERLAVSEQTVEDIKNVFKGFFGVLRIGLNVVTTAAHFAFDIFSKIVGAIFPAFSAGGGGILHFFGNIGGAIGDFAASLGSLGGRWNKIWRVLAKFNVIFDPIIDKIKMAADWIKGQLAKIDFEKVTDDFIAGFNAVAAFFEPFKTSIYDGITAIGNFIAAFDFTPAYEAVTSFFAPITGLLFGYKEEADGAAESSGELSDALVRFGNTASENEEQVSIFDRISSALKTFQEKLIKARDAVIEFTAPIREFFAPIIELIGQKIKELTDDLKNFDISAHLPEILLGLMSGIYLKNVFGFFKNIGGFFKSLKGFVDNIGDTFENLAGALEGFQKTVKVSFFLLLALALVALAVALTILSKIDADKVLGSASALGVLMAGLGVLVGGMSALAKWVGDSDSFNKTLSTMATSILKLSIGMAALAWGMSKLAAIPTDQVWGAMAAFSVLLVVVGALAVVFSALEDPSALSKAAISIIALAIALRIAAASVAKFAEMDINNLKQGIGAMAVVLGLMSAFAAIVSLKSIGPITFDPRALLNAGIGMIALAGALMLMAKVVERFAGIDEDRFVLGVQRILDMLLRLAVFVIATKLSKNVLSAGLGMIALAAALLIFRHAIQAFADLEPGVWEKGFDAVASIIMLMSAFTFITGFSKNVLGAAAGMVVLSVALLALAGIVAIFANFDGDTLRNGIFAIAGLIAVLSVGLLALTGFSLLMKDLDLSINLGLLASMLVLVIVIDALAFALMGLALVPMDGLVTAMIAVIAVLVTMATIIGVLSFAGSQLLLVGAAFLLFGVAILAVAVAVPMLVAGLLSLIPLVYAFAAIPSDTMAVGLETLRLITNEFAYSILKLGGALLVFGLAVAVTAIGVAGLAIGLGALGIAALIASVGFTVLVGAVALLVYTVIQMGRVISENANQILMGAQVMSVAITAVINAIVIALANAIPLFLTKFAEGIIRFFEVLQEGKQKLKMAALEAMLEFAAVLREAAPTLANTAVFLIQTFLLAIYDALVSLVTIVGAGILKAVEILQPYIEVAMARIAQTIINSLINILEVAASLIPVFGSDLVNGLEEAKDRVNETIGSIDTKALGETSIDGIIDGLRGKDDEITAAGSKVGKGVTDAYEAVAGEEQTKAKGEESALGFISGLISGSGSFPTDGAAIGDTILSTLNVSDEAGMVGGDVFSSFTDSFASEENLDYSKMVGGLVGTSSLDGITELNTDFFNAGELSVDGFTQGLTSSESLKAMMTSGNTMGITSLDGITTALGIHSPSTQFRNVGIYSVNGFVAGLAGKNSIAKVSDAARRVAEAALRAMNQRLDIHSPSKEFAKIGKYADEGLAQGLTDNKGVVEQAAIGTGASTNDKLYNFLHEVFTDTMDQMTILFDDAAHRISDGFADLGFTCGESLTNSVAEGIDMEAVTSEIELPEDLADQEMTITPVIDYSQIQNDSNYLDEMLGDKTIGISDTAIDSANDAGSNITAKLDEINGNLIGIKEEAIEVMVDLTRIIQAGIDKGQTVNVEIRNEVGGKTVAYEQRTFNTAEQQRVGKSYTGKG